MTIRDPRRKVQFEHIPFTRRHLNAHGQIVEEPYWMSAYVGDGGAFYVKSVSRGWKVVPWGLKAVEQQKLPLHMNVVNAILNAVEQARG